MEKGNMGLWSTKRRVLEGKREPGLPIAIAFYTVWYMTAH